MPNPLEIDPPQPPGGEYSVSALVPKAILIYTNQADFTMKNNGKPCPAYNPLLPIKRWTDSAVSAAGYSLLTYHTIHLDPSMQNPVQTDIQVPSYLAGIVNIPPDTGPIPPSSAGELLTPMRLLLANEKLNPKEGGLIDVVNLDIFNPFASASGPSTGGAGLTPAEHAVLFAIAKEMKIALPE